MFHHQFLGKEFNTSNTPLQNSIDSLSDSLGLPVKHVNQIHGDNIVVIRIQDQNVIDIQADAIICPLPNVVIGVRTADCLPLLISGFNKLGQSVVAAVHLGRASALLELATKVINRLSTDFGFEVSDLTCYIGPHLRQFNHVSFEDEWSHFPPKFVTKIDTGMHIINNAKLLQSYLDKNNLKVADLSTWQSARIDLTGFVVEQLTDCGLGLDQIKIDLTDTFADSNFNSYRRDYPSSGRNFSYIWFE
jgi:copper oxidase (laccase) domain-containing protein